MVRIGVLVVFLAGLGACAEEPLPPPPTSGSGNGKTDTPNGGGDDCRDACKKLLVECGDEDESLALEDCQEQCGSALLSVGEMDCLSSMECGEPSDTCMGG